MRFLILLIISILSSLAILIINQAFFDHQVAMLAAALFFLGASFYIIYLMYDTSGHSTGHISDQTMLMRELIDLKASPVAITDRSGRLVVSNAEFDRLFSGRTNIRKILADGMSEETAEELFSEIKALGRSAFTADSSRHDMLWRAVVGKVADEGTILWSFDTFFAEQQLTVYADIFHSWAEKILEGLGGAIVLRGVSGRVYYISPTLCSWLGKTAAEIGDKIPYNRETECLMIAPGKQLNVHSVEGPIYGQDGKELIGSLTFFGKKDKLNLGPKEGGNVLDSAAILEGAPFVIALVDEHMKLVAFNAPLEMQFKDIFDDLEGLGFLSLIEEKDRDVVRDSLKESIGGITSSVPIEVEYRSDKNRISMLTFAPYTHSSGPGAVVYGMDKTHEKSLEAQFVQAQKMQAVGQLAGGVAHDFNNLLTAIMGFCDLLLLRHGPGEESYSDISQIQQNANRAANLVRQLLAFSRQQTMRPRTLVVSDVVADLSNLLRRLIGEGIEFDVRHERNLPQVRVDQGQLEQVIINLAVNARDAMSGAGKMEISTRSVTRDDQLLKNHKQVSEEDFVCISVSDTGSGIDDTVRDKIFEPFFTTKKVGEGTGLGLSTVYGIIKQMGGYIFFDTEMGKGTTFHILLRPSQVKPAVTEATGHSEVIKDLSGKATILFVEDELPVRMFATRALRNKGYTVYEAGSGDEALAVMKDLDGPLDLMITDVVMPNMDGPTLVTHVRREMPTLPVIFISGYAEDVLRDELADDSFQFLSKPFSLKDLAEKVHQIVS